MTPIAEESLKFHYEKKGKIEVVSTVQVGDAHDLSLAYTPGVAQPCLEIQKDVDKSYELTRRWNLCLVVTDGSAVLGLGDIGPEAGMPVMEGKCALFQAFAGIDAFPLCVRSKDVDEIVHTIEMIAGSFGGINLEDIGAPRCFEVERKLKERLDIPVFHDDQHGTAVITVSAMLNALKLVGKNIEEVSAVVNGAGAAGTACTKLLMALGLKNVVVCDRMGALVPGLPGMTPAQAQLAEETNPQRKSGSLAEVIQGADVFMGFSAPGVLTGDMVKRVKNRAIPTRTMLGGFCCRPRAVRRKEKEMMYRVKEVIITTMEGMRVRMVVRNRICRVCTFSPLTLINASKRPGLLISFSAG